MPTLLTEQAIADAKMLIDPEPGVRVVDRSTLDRYATCPAQARFVDTGAVLNKSLAMESGNAAHAALSQATDEYVASRGALSVTDLIELVQQQACAARPDIQPDVIRALPKSCLWPWAKFLSGMHWKNVLRFDGGAGEQSGQIAWDIPDLRVRVTSEVDLLHAGPSPELIHEVDYKTGNARWSAASIADSFQFALHGWLLLHNYPDVKAASIRVWNTRTGGPTYAVEFRRDDLYRLDWRVRSAAAEYVANVDKAPQDAPTWPTVEKCEMCPAAALCPACGPLIGESFGDPQRLVDLIVATDAKLTALKKLAAGCVESMGADIVTASGNCFGVGKPKAARKPTMGIYAAKSQEAETDGGE